MSKRIIIIHGRNTKPAKAPYEELQKKALIQGVKRVNPPKAAQLETGQIPIDFVYYGDVNNRLLKTTQDDLSQTDPDFGNAPCLPHNGVEQTIDTLGAISKHSKTAYSKILRDNIDYRWLDDAVRAFSTISAITTATFLNMAAISHATADMGAYLLTRKVGSEVRDRLQDKLKPALINGDDICLISHSMGCMVSYDVLWKFSRMSEYRDVRANNPKVNLWLTLGCPLGEAGVKRNLYDGHERDKDRYPENIIHDWVNIAAKDDFVAHDATMKGDYRLMKRWEFLNSIEDKRIYNCYASNGRSNPHKFYGYLAHEMVGGYVAKWI